MSEHSVIVSDTPLMDHDVLDLVCVGFGPASLAIAVALEDRLESTNQTHQDDPVNPRVRYLERQESFKWHPGMLIQSAKMQISFLKDLATARNPLSRFTFLNYLKQHGRLAHFARLNTFLPSRAEFADYLKWVAGHFEDQVSYGHEVLQIRPVKRHVKTKVSYFEIEARHLSTGTITTFHARRIVIGIGGTPNIPTPFHHHYHTHTPHLLHSSTYTTTIPTLLPTTSHPYHIAILGGGQSAAEIFTDLPHRYPNAHTTLILRDSALRPSDDSPFVNSIFDPARTDTFYARAADDRAGDIRRDKATNYGVVRAELIERIYMEMCVQGMMECKDEGVGKRRVMARTEVVGVDVDVIENENRNPGGSGPVTLTLRTKGDDGTWYTHTLNVDVVILATGYVRKSHLEMLRPCEGLKVGGEWMVQRDYRVVMDDNRVEGDGDVGVWLLGCNEETHGLSDSLLSVVATRGGEVVRSIFGEEDGERRGVGVV